MRCKLNYGRPIFHVANRHRKSPVFVTLLALQPCTLRSRRATVADAG